MNWRPLDIVPHDVLLATGESLRTVASFQGFDGDHDILKAHIAFDGGDLVLITEFEDPTGKRKLGRTTQWPREILYHCMNRSTAALFDAVDSEPVMLASDSDEDVQNKAIMESLTQAEIAEAGSKSLAYMRKKIALKADLGDSDGGITDGPHATNPDNPASEATGGSGESAAPVGIVVEPKGEVTAEPKDTDHALMRHAAMASDPLLAGSQPETTGSEGPGATEESGGNLSSPTPKPDDGLMVTSPGERAMFEDAQDDGTPPEAA